ncbi:hypothetical protein A3A67_02590 [Candidatus Peribacteria bacterium RIFCSPLOWO2_01_FULL_51_18]|nr:MAG: hypothetical protein A3C52_00480 [Candidatus Peribacteria bacterium RIFCSPHIGHO2_02_FULL_51_15]OGJ66899.1 MAG: hypothetical protein A3A67_02590 [Candidatus Peribacteria bacterium RIFCSPLOWO2_01_FULL_51_18]
MQLEQFSPQEDSTSRWPDPEQKMAKKDLEDLRTKIAERPEMSLPQFLRGSKDLFQKRQYSICNRLNTLTKKREKPGWTKREIAKYENLTNVLSTIEDDARRIESDKEENKEDEGVEWFTDSMNLLRKAERLIADLEKVIHAEEKDKEGETSWVTFEQEQRSLWMQSMLTYGLPTDLLKDGKNPEIQTLAVPDNVTVTTIGGVDFQTVATEEEYKIKDPVKDKRTDRDLTAFGEYARKITQFRKLIHLKIPEGQTPVLKFEWADASGQQMECTVTGRQRENKSWIFQMAQAGTEDGGGRRGRRGWFR